MTRPEFLAPLKRIEERMDAIDAHLEAIEAEIMAMIQKAKS